MSDNPPKTPAYVLHYSSFTPPSSGHKLYFVFHNKSSCQVWFFASIDRSLIFSTCMSVHVSSACMYFIFQLSNQ